MQMPKITQPNASASGCLTSTARQVEALLRFGVGSYLANQEYEDDFRVIALGNLTSLSGFWFDCITSIPWSWLDLQIYTVPMCPEYVYRVDMSLFNS